MCNLYSLTKGQAAIIAITRALRDSTGNLPPLPGVYPDYNAPIVRNAGGERELALARWGMPSSHQALFDATKRRAQKLEAKGKPVEFAQLLRMEPDIGTTNIRNVKSKHWTRWLASSTAASCPSPRSANSTRRPAVKSGLRSGRKGHWRFSPESGTNWTSVRKVREGVTTNDLYAFLTTEPNADVGRYHPKAMPVILTTAEVRIPAKQGHRMSFTNVPRSKTLRHERVLQHLHQPTTRSSALPALY